MPSQTRLIRHEGEAGRLELVLWEPDVRLRADVLVLEDYEERAAEPVTSTSGHGTACTIPPTPRSRGVRLVRGRPTRVRCGDGVAGNGALRAGQPDPLGAHRFLGVAMHELAGRVVSLSDVLGRAADGLEERLAEAPDANARLALVESSLVARLAAAAPARPDVQYAWRRLEETGGRLRIGALAAELGCSRKHLGAQFREHVGLPPKAVARLRFNMALRLVERGLTGAEVAYRGGYTDQAHFVNEFRRFSGETPAAFARAPAGAISTRPRVSAPPSVAETRRRLR